MESFRNRLLRHVELIWEKIAADRHWRKCDAALSQKFHIFHTFYPFKTEQRKKYHFQSKPLFVEKI